MKVSIPQEIDNNLPNILSENLSPLSIIKWAVDTFGSKLAVTSSFGLNGVVLIHMLQKITRKVPIIFINTGYMFEETLKTKRRIEKACRVKILTYHPRLTVKDQIQKFGPALFICQPDTCCNLRKVEPMQRALSELQPIALLNGRARFHDKNRQNLPIIEWEKKPIQINPLTAWSQKQIELYIKNHNVPYNPLYDIGYLSIGCRPCTRPVLKGEHIRAGRWAELEKRECGLWTKNLMQ